MRSSVPGLLAFAAFALSLVAPPPAARADDVGACNQPGDADDVANVRAAVAVQCDCGGATSHGQYVRCVNGVVSDAIDHGQLRGSCRGKIVRCAARATCGRQEGAVACCRTSAKGKKTCSTKRSADECTAPRGGSACASEQASCCDACSSGACASASARGGIPGPPACSPPTCRSQIAEQCGRPGGRDWEPCWKGVIAACESGDIVCGAGATTTTTAAPPTTTTTTSATTSTTVFSSTTTSTTGASSTTTSTTPPPTCGDGMLDPGEQCDPPGSLTCPPSSPGGAMLECQPGCVCPGGATTTTTVVATTSTTTGATTSTTAPATTTTTSAATTSTTAPATTTTTTAATTTTTQPAAFTKLTFTTVLGTSSCGSGGLGTPPSAPLSGQLDSDSACTTKISDLGLGCLYFGGGKATIVPPGLIPDGAASTFAITGAGTLGGGAGTGPGDCTLGAGPGTHCINGFCNTDADCDGTAGSCSGNRCTSGTQTTPLTCASNADCGGCAGCCAKDANCFFGPPLPITSPPPNDALTTCVQNVITTTATGTFDAATGASSVFLPLGSRVYITGNSASPCPKCISGTCDASWTDVNGSPAEDNGSACSAGGTLLTTLDCRPPLAGFQAELPVDLTPLTTGTAAKTATDGRICAAVGQTVANAGAFGKATTQCIQETGTPAGDISDGQPHTSAIAAVFCIPKTGNVAVDGVAALPGPGAIGINGTVQAQ